MNNFSNYTLPVPAPFVKRSTITREIAVHLTGKTMLLKPEDITCLEGEGNYTFIHTCRGKRYLVSRTLKSLTEHLDGNFLRVHKSYIINTNFIVERMDEDRVITMSCGKKALVSRRKMKEIIEILDKRESRISA
ncbi:LytR/AlgR family response regulator transcription factor [Persicitalea jodogahamensis]|uniref:HTH LytTR-type domain-containing protein n=1 Tax=Persicitalea jodogahamensis TaxID=402147 RepID=A0A8J3D5N0_9BACT|nr:LytTR family DNA-binding domain-containing protein [Persicitalea jodogahamensis]GHB78471.1 hypothetical protein GCM10007390_35950 [Persicitalea jodogahamensis]